jgi:hypothetical protein
MLNCTWASALTKYDCRQVNGLDGNVGLEIGTPFSMPGGAAINLYLMPLDKHVLISDNGDTLMHLSGMGIDVWNPSRMRSLREMILPYGLTLSDSGDFKMISTEAGAVSKFATTITALLTVNHWAMGQLNVESKGYDLAAEAEPYIVARNPNLPIKLNPKVRGASASEHTFNFLHGNELIDVITPYPVSTGMELRKIGDVSNGPFLEGKSLLVIIDDRFEPLRAQSELAMLGATVRAQTFSSLIHTVH